MSRATLSELAKAPSVCQVDRRMNMLERGASQDREGDADVQDVIAAVEDIVKNFAR